jgi:hypothetical protein
MRKLCSLLLLCLMNAAAFAQSTATAGVNDAETVSPFVVYAFLIVFVGGIIGVGFYMWISDKKPDGEAALKK